MFDFTRDADFMAGIAAFTPGLARMADSLGVIS
jgi:hypothetical protein